jgi:hypothetical protein
MSDKPLSNLVVIDDSMVMAIMNDNKILSQIPPIKVAVSNAKAKSDAGINRKAGCKPCQSKARNLAINLMVVKKAIAQLPNDMKKKLKELLNAKEVRIVYKNDSGKLIQLTY